MANGDEPAKKSDLTSRAPVGSACDKAVAELKFRRLFEAAQDGIFLVNAKTSVIEDANPFLEDLLGYKHEDLVGQKFFDVGFIKDAIADKEVFKKLQREKTVRYEILPLETKDGRKIDVEFVGHVYSVGDQEVIQCSIRDITEFKRTKEKMRESEERYRTMVDSAHDIIWLLDLQGNVTYLNKRGAEISNRDVSDIIGKKYSFRIIEEDLPKVRDAVAQTLQGKPQSFEARICNFDDEILYLDVNQQPLFQDGKIIGAACFGCDVTDRKKTEDALAESEMRYRAYVENQVDMPYALDLTGIVTYIGPQANRVGGYGEGEILGKKFKDYVHPDDRARLVKSFLLVLLKGEAPPSEARFLKKDGQYIWLEVATRRQLDKHGKPIGGTGLARDITVRKKMEEKLLESEKRYRAYAENQQDILYSLDAAGTFNYVSPHISRYGWKPEDLIGHVFTDFVYPDDRVKFRKHFADVMREGSGASMAVRFFDSARNVVWFEVASKREFGANGKAVGAIGIARDVTDRRRAEIALADFQRRYQTFIENAPDAAYEIDLEGGVIFVGSQIGNRKLPPSSGGKTAKFTDFIVPEDRKRIPDMVHKLISTDEKQTAEFRIALPDGANVWVESVANLHKDESGKPISVMGMLRDITERKGIEERVREMDQIRSRFMQVVSHQLRTPLNSIRWNLEILLSDDMGRLTDAQREFVRLIYDAEIEVMRRINQMLVALDIQERKVVLSRESASLEVLWSSVMASLSRRAAMKEIDFRYQPPAEPLPPLLMDTEKIRESMLSLALNSLEYTPDKGRILVSISRVGERARFEITDSGVGVPESDQPRLFQRFFRAGNASVVRQDASGLGLYIARNFIEAHGGQIGLTSREGKGSTFWFELPLA